MLNLEANPKEEAIPVCAYGVGVLYGLDYLGSQNRLAGNHFSIKCVPNRQENEPVNYERNRNIRSQSQDYELDFTVTISNTHEERLPILKKCQRKLVFAKR